jgi:hypothetical protein
MRIKLYGNVVIIPDKLIKKINTLDKECASAIEVLLAKGERVTSTKKQKAIEYATQKKVLKTKEKIQNAINLIRLEGNKITPYRVAKIGGVSYQTAKKYLKLANLI